MRLAYLTSQYPAPSHTFIRREVEALRRRGFELHTFSVRKPPAAASEAERQAAGSTWYVLPVGPWALLSAHLEAAIRHPGAYWSTLIRAMRHRVPGIRALLWSVFYFVEAIVLARELERRAIEHLHNHFANAAANVGHLAAGYLGIGWSLTLHGISEFDYPAGLLLADKIRAARFVPCVSYAGRAQAMRLVEPEHWHKLFVSRCGVEASITAKDEPNHDGSLRIVCVGRLSPEKGHHGLLQAFARLLQSRPHARLLLVGSGPGQHAIEQSIADRGLMENVELLGRLPEHDTLETIAHADILVSASFMEGLPVVLMEALGMGVPVIAPWVSGIPELVEHEHTGLLFAPGDWEALTQCLVRLADDPSLRASLASAGRERIKSEFVIDRAIEPLVARFEAVQRVTGP